MRTYIHTYKLFRRSTNSVIQQSDMKPVRNRTHNTPTKQTQYNTNNEMSILQSAKSNTVPNITIKQYNTNYYTNNLSN